MTVDIVIFGATGFTGRLVTEYFLRHADSGLTWAIAARSRDKLEALQRDLKTQLEADGLDPHVVDAVPIIVADGMDRDAVRALVQSTRVVVSLAGAYARYSALVVELCAEHGVHYCDIAAEVLWAASNAEAFDAKARTTGARIVHCCGFEAVPSDLLTFLLADAVANEKEGAKLSRVQFYWNASMGGASGGTIRSLLSMLDSLTPDDRGNLMAPYLFTPRAYALEKQHLIPANTSSKNLVYDQELQARTAFFWTGMIDQQVVLRSNYLLNEQYGAAFAYIERMSLKSALNWAISAAMTVMVGLMSWKWTRKLLWKVAPASGTGPSRRAMKKGYFAAEAHAYDTDGKLAAKGEVSGVGDPGYLISSKLVSEVAFCLARGEHNGGVDGGGFLTPATAGGHSLVQRLRDKKIIDIHVRPKDGSAK